jgi:hypothetical protein
MLTMNTPQHAALCVSVQKYGTHRDAVKVGVRPPLLARLAALRHLPGRQVRPQQHRLLTRLRLRRRVPLQDPR